ncbi:MAG TPA: hypothetical protein VM686_38285 [Polyangiaceae bacterium]|jgi:hypothetical protein|nr:hypothetical protein [Polyangiaceae bacterium]
MSQVPERIASPATCLGKLLPSPSHAPDCRCADCLIYRGETIAAVRSWLQDWAPRAPRTTPEGWAYANAETFVLAHGSNWEHGPFTVEERRYVTETVKRARLVPKMGQCWRNARQALLLGDANRRLAYVEGYTTGRGIHHGWLLLEGKVVDITLNAGTFRLKAVTPPKQRRFGEVEAPHTGLEYFGVQFPRWTVERCNWREPHALADYRDDFPLDTLRAPWGAGEQ